MFAVIQSMCGRRVLSMVVAALLAAGVLADRVAVQASAADLTQEVSERKPRIWTDSTGSHQVHGTLVELGREYARILKENGKSTTVPLNRLSSADQTYIDQIRLRTSMSAAGENSAADETPPTAQGAVPAEYSEVIHLRLSESLIAKFVESSYSSSRAVSETFNDIPSRGTLDSYSRSALAFAEDKQQAVIIVKVRGINQSRTTSFAGEFQVHSVGATDFARNIRLTLGKHGFEVAASRLAVRRVTQITGVWTPFKHLLGEIAECIVLKEAERQKPSIDRQAEQRERDEIELEMSERLGAALFQMNQFRKRSIDVFEKLQATFQIEPHFRTTDEHLIISLAAPAKSLLNPPQEPPPQAPDAPFVAQIHSSVFLKAITEAQVIASLRPVLDEMLSRKSETVEQLRETIQQGKIDSKWTDDKQWFTVTWQPPEEISPLDLESRGGVNQTE